jgi:hypothetical protein
LAFQKCYNVQSHKQEKKLRWHNDYTDRNVMLKEIYSAMIIEHLPATLPRPSSDTVTSGVWGQDSNLDLNSTVSNPSITRIIWGLSWSMPLTNSCYLVHIKLTVIRTWSIIKNYKQNAKDAKGNEVYISNSTCTFSFIKRGVSSHPDKHFQPTIQNVTFICV